MAGDIMNVRPWQEIRFAGARLNIFAWQILRDLPSGDWLAVLVFLYSVIFFFRGAVEKSQVRRIRRLGYWAGCRGWARGLSWDRRSRYGEK